MCVRACVCVCVYTQRLKDGSPDLVAFLDRQQAAAAATAAADNNRQILYIYIYIYISVYMTTVKIRGISYGPI